MAFRNPIEAGPDDVLAARQAEYAHLETFLDRHTTLPLTEVRAMKETVGDAVRKTEAKLGEGLVEAQLLLTRCVRAAELLELDVLNHLTEARTRVGYVQSVLAERRGEQ
jgi:hypothetical protein